MTIDTSSGRVDNWTGFSPGKHAHNEMSISPQRAIAMVRRFGAKRLPPMGYEGVLVVDHGVDFDNRKHSPNTTVMLVNRCGAYSLAKHQSVPPPSYTH